MTRFSVVIPVYKNQDSLPLVVEELEKMNLRLEKDLEAVFVVDGSPDESFSELVAGSSFSFPGLGSFAQFWIFPRDPSRPNECLGSLFCGHGRGFAGASRADHDLF